MDKVKLAVGNWESALEAAGRLIQTIPDTPSAETGSVTVNGVDFKQCDQIISGIESVNSKIKNIGDIIVFKDNNLTIKSIYDVLDKQTLDIVGFNKSNYPTETKIDVAKFTKQELSSMCDKLIKSCQNIDKIDDLIWNTMVNIPAVLDALDSPGIFDRVFNTASNQLHRSLNDLLILVNSTAATLATCNKSFIRIVKARAKA